MSPANAARARKTRATPRSARQGARRRWPAWVAGIAVVALVVTLAVVVSGFDSRETPREDPSVWVARTSGQYARVNTDTAEIDTVRVVDNPSAVVQSPQVSLMLTQGYGRAWAINAVAPRDLQESDGAAAEGSGTDATEDAGAADGIDGAGIDGAGGDGVGGDGAGSVGGDEAGGDGAEGSGAIRTPDGTRQVIAQGDAVLFHTESGEAYLSQVVPGTGFEPATVSAAVRLDPFADERAEAEAAARTAASDGENGDADDAGAGEAAAGEADTDDRLSYVVAAAAIDASGRVALFSPSEQAVRWYDVPRAAFRGGAQAVPAGVPAEEVQLTIVGGKWALLDAAGGRLWIEGRSAAVELDLVGDALLQGSSATGSEVLVADEAGLWAVLSDGSAERVAVASGVPAQPQHTGGAGGAGGAGQTGAGQAGANGEMVAAWVSANAAQMWRSGALTTLEFDETVDDVADPAPVIRTNGSRALIAETRTGMMWTVPDGQLIPVEQWALANPPKHEQGEVVTQDVTEQEPPVAVNDTFGVRAGEPTMLPVLLNDYDPNRRDVLTVVPDGLGEGLDPEFGAVSSLSDGQGLSVHPSTAAQGSASFRYRITDGVNVSEPATVTLTVVGDDTNTAPEWCAVEGCQRSWPSPELTPGGTLVLPILEGWVDPEGDPMMLADAAPMNAEDPVRAIVTADGRLAVRHTDPNAPDSEVGVRVSIADARGESTERELRVRVRTGASGELQSMATTVKVDETQTVRPLERATGGSGSFQLVDASVQQGAVTAAVNTGAGTIDITAAAAGNAIIGVTVRDTVTEQEIAGVVRVTAVESRGATAVPPLRAFVRPLADTTVDVLAALPGANSRALTVQSALVSDGQLRADVIEHSRIRVSGATADGQPGRIGAVDLTIDEGGVTSAGRLTVFQVPEGVTGAIAVADTATVRAGSVVDINVLDNDVAPPGERLVLHPEVSSPGIDGELAFASGSRVRYLAPELPGTYTLSYTAYGASSPEVSDVGHVTVTVLPSGSNRAPQPATVTVRVAPGERATVLVPLSGVDPDGDRVRLVSVNTPDDAQLSATIRSRSSSIEVEASQSAALGSHVVGYTVRDGYGGEAEGRLRVIVTEPDPGGGAPVVYSDYVRMARGAVKPAVVRPLDNDLDPSGGELELVSVVPNVPGGAESARYAELTQRLDLTRLDEGIVTIRGGEELGTVSFKYTVRSSQSTSTADGLIVVQVSERIGVQAPSVTDTVLSVRDRADFESTGVDVVTDRVRWVGGDVGSLTLSLWGTAADRYTVSGSSILGSYRAEGDLVPFRLTGLDATGVEVKSFGFLVVPPLDELRLSLKPGAPMISVDEDHSVTVDVVDLFDLGPGDTVEIAQGAFATQRSQASCESTGTTSLRYSAGKEAPWADSCTVRVRLTEQNTYTALALPVSIIPREPVVQLSPLTRTVAPGESETIDLTDMVLWQGGREGQVSSLQWQMPAASGAIEATITGSTVQVVVPATSRPGSQQTANVTVRGAGESQAVLTLRVGEAPADLPRGATVTLQCTVGENCEMPLVGQRGEHDPFAGKPGGGLELVSVDGGSCAYGNLQAAGDSVRVNWADSRGSGGRCTASFTVRDAQQRVGTGTIEFDAHGVPRAPARIEATGANANDVILTVTLSEQAAHPAVTGVEILRENGDVVTDCTASGSVAVCTVANAPKGKENERVYFARAVNAVGPSERTGPSRGTWAYEPPAAPEVTAVAEKSATNTRRDRGTVDLTITGSSSALRLILKIDGPNGAGRETETPRTSRHELPPGEYVFTVTPVNDELPPGYQGAPQGSTGTARATVSAAPISTSANALVPTGNTTVRVELGAWDENYGSDLTFRYGIGAPGGAAPETCTQESADFAGLQRFASYAAVVCAQSDSGATTVSTASVWVGGSPEALVVSSGYVIGATASGSGLQRSWTTVAAQPAFTGVADGASIHYSTGAHGDLTSVPLGGGVTAWQCIEGTEYCSPPVAVGAQGASAVRITQANTCVASGGDLSSLFTIEGTPPSAPIYTEEDSDIRISWVDDIWNSVLFTDAICAPPEDPDPPVDPGPSDPSETGD